MLITHLVIIIFNYYCCIFRSPKFVHFSKIGYALADSDYDIWMGNARGNVYSRAHIRYDPDGSRSDREKFWKFSWHEIGV